MRSTNIPEADQELAFAAKHPTLLGYHDLAIGNEPNSRLRKFSKDSLPTALPAATLRFHDFHDLLFAYVKGELDYRQFNHLRKRRLAGEPESLLEEENADQFNFEDDV